MLRHAACWKINCFVRQKRIFCQNWLACLRLPYCLSSCMLSVSKVIMGRGNNGTYWMIAKNTWFFKYSLLKNHIAFYQYKKNVCWLKNDKISKDEKTFQHLLFITIYWIGKKQIMGNIFMAFKRYNTHAQNTFKEIGIEK